MDAEMRSHVELRTQANIESGMNPEEARFAALRQFGWTESIKETCREQRGVVWLENLVRDLRFSARQLLKNPGFTSVAILTLALGIGANTAIFSLINGIMLRPVMSRDPEQLAGVYQHNRDDANRFSLFSYPDFADLRASNEAFTDLFAFGFASVGFQEGDTTEMVSAGMVTANYFSGLGVAPALGRSFLAEEETSATPVAVLSHAFWNRLGADPSIIGRKLKLTRGEVTVVGVMPREFSGALLRAPALFVPIAMADALTANQGSGNGRILQDRADRRLMLMGRLKPGLTVENAAGALSVLSRRFAIPDPGDPKARSLICTAPSRFEFGSYPGGGTRRMAPLATLAFGLSTLVLLIACVNLANMMLARGAARRKEIAIRLALGARPQRILRQLLTEGMLLASLGGAGGLLVSNWATSFLSAFLLAAPSADIPQFNFSPDWRVLVTLLSLSVLATLFFALGPAWKLTRLGVNADLKHHAADDAHETRQGRLGTHHLLAVGQMAFALALLAAAALFTRSAMNAAQANLGFEFGSNFYLALHGSVTGDTEPRARELVRGATDSLAALPGVESVSAAVNMPFGESIRNVRPVQLGGAPPPSDTATTFAEGRVRLAYYNVVGADYFHTLGIPLRRGRDFERREAADAHGQRVVIISQNFADQLWPGQDAIGRSIQFPGDVRGTPPTLVTVVGITPDINWDILNKQPQFWFYLPLGQEFQADLKLHVRVVPGIDPASLMAAARNELRRLDQRIVPKEVKTLAAVHRDGPVRIFQLGSMLFGAFGALAMLLSFLGIYGLKAYSVARRTREIGIRMALGANGRDVVAMILRESAGLAGLGLCLGLLLALAVGKLTARFLYQVPALDPVTFVVIPPLMLGVALAACILPARRASKIDPMEALRRE